MKLPITLNPISTLILVHFVGSTDAFMCTSSEIVYSRRCSILTHTMMSNNENYDERHDIDELHSRRALFRILGATAFGGISSLPTFPSQVRAEEEGEETVAPSTFRRVNTKLNLGYEFITPPSVIKTSNKPLQTHLDEINLPTNTKGYTYGITVDPIRIKSLKDFGTPSEVAAKIVMAELRRDGVLDVTLARDAKEDDRVGAYDIEYISDGTRGKKHFVTRSIVRDGKLFVLTVQVKQDDWKGLESEVIEAVQSFRVLGQDEY